MTHEQRRKDSEPSRAPAALGRFLAAYRGQLSRAEAARRAGLAEARWAEIECSTSTSVSVPPHTVASMCAAVGADIGRGLELAGHDPRAYGYFITTPPGLMHLSPPRAPRVASYRAIGDVLASPGQDPVPPIGAIYLEAATANRQLADSLVEEPPDGRRQYWEGYAAALHALAAEQLRMAEQRSPEDT